MGYIESLDDRVSKLVQIYTERNNCAIALVKAAIAAGWKAGRGTDPVAVESWSNVVYIDLPNGKQVSYHISPDQAHLLEGLPAYDGQWDGTYVGRDPNWAGF